ncbi:hypothetical protein [Marivita sp. S2033]|uniref:hypothetical protein n=1 Tax=Marivita sp. S2033 TaxID=3373187 RepID=UPI0039823E86
MRIAIGLLGLGMTLAGCAQVGLSPSSGDSGQVRPQQRPEVTEMTARKPPSSARTAEEFDTTTAQERAAAAAPKASSERALGSTTVSLGDPARPGFWIETPLVSSEGSGRVVYPATGKASQVDLLPIDGPPTAGSRMSLAAMRLIGVPLTGLVDVDVFSGG